LYTRQGIFSTINKSNKKQQSPDTKNNSKTLIKASRIQIKTQTPISGISTKKTDTTELAKLNTVAKKPQRYVKHARTTKSPTFMCLPTQV